MASLMCGASAFAQPAAEKLATTFVVRMTDTRTRQQRVWFRRVSLTCTRSSAAATPRCELLAVDLDRCDGRPGAQSRIEYGQGYAAVAWSGERLSLVLGRQEPSHMLTLQVTRDGKVERITGGGYEGDVLVTRWELARASDVRCTP